MTIRGIDPSEFDRGVAAMKTAIPADLSANARQFLGDRVPRHNEPSLGSRLREYGERITQVLPKGLPYFKRDRNAIKDLRDEFSHSFQRNDNRIPEEHGQKLLYDSQLLKLLFEFNLLHHLGVCPPQLENIFARRFTSHVSPHFKLIFYTCDLPAVLKSLILLDRRQKIRENVVPRDFMFRLT